MTFEQSIQSSTAGSTLITLERQRQIEEESYKAYQDDMYMNGELIRAARSYTTAVLNRFNVHTTVNIYTEWPWDPSLLKPKDSIRDLVRAGALIAAEIDRLLRLQDLEIRMAKLGVQ